MSASPYQLFGTDANLETKGIRIDYGSFYFVVARAGGANTKFAQVAREKLLPYQRAIQLNEMDEAKAQQLTADAFAEAVLQGWGKIVDGKDVPDLMPGPDGKDLKFSVENAKLLFADLPELVKDLMGEASKLANFRKLAGEADAKN